MSHIDVARQSAKGTFILLIGNVISTAVLATTAIIIARLLGPDSYGLYTLALLVPSLFLYLVGFGVNLVVTRYPAYYLSKGEPERARSATIDAMAFLIITGGALSILVYFAGGPISALLMNRPDLGPYVQVASTILVGQTILHACTAAFIGWHATGLASFTSVLQAILKLGLSAGLIVAGYGVSGAVWGHASGYAIAGGISLAILYATKLKGKLSRSAGIVAGWRDMIRYGAPPFVGNLVSGLASQFIVIILALIAANGVVGNYQAAVNVTAAITVGSSALANSLFAAFSSLDGMKGDTSLAFRYAVKYVSLVIVPVVVFLAGSASVLVQVLYGSTYSAATPYLQLIALSYTPLAIGLNVIPNFFNGVGKTKFTMAFLVAGAATLVALAPILGVFARLGVSGIILALFISNLASCVLGLYLARSRLRIGIEMWPAVAVLLSCAIALGAASLIPTTIGAIPALGAELLVFIVAYATALPMLKGVSDSDIDRLYVAAEGLGALKVAVRPFLRYQVLILKKTGQSR